MQTLTGTPSHASLTRYVTWRLHVRHVTARSRRMRRVELAGSDLEGFSTAAFDDHVKVFVRAAAGRDGHRFDPRWIKASAYWRKGDVGRHGVLTDA